MPLSTQQNQISVIEDLRNSPYIQTSLPKLPFCDFKFIYNQVRRKRKNQIDDRKWQTFIERNNKDPEIIAVSNSKNIAKEIDLKHESFEVPPNYVYNTYSHESEENLKLDGLNFKHEKYKKTYENLGGSLVCAPLNLDIKNLQECSNNENLQGLNNSELYSILKKVRRQRKMMKDEEKWRNFNNMIHQIPVQNYINLPVQQDREGASKNSENSKDGTNRKLLYELLDNSGSKMELLSDEESKNFVSDNDVEIIENVKETIIPKIKNINNLLKKNFVQPLVDQKAEYNDKQQSRFRDRFRKCYLSRMNQKIKILRSSTLCSRSNLNSTLAGKLLEDFETLFCAVEAIENQLKKEALAKSTKELISLFFNKSYSFLVLLNGFPTQEENEKELENLILETLHLLRNTVCEEKITMTENLDERFQTGNPYQPEGSFQVLRIKETAALAHAKFGSPTKRKHNPNEIDNEAVMESLEVRPAVRGRHRKDVQVLKRVPQAEKDCIRFKMEKVVNHSSDLSSSIKTFSQESLKKAQNGMCESDIFKSSQEEIICKNGVMKDTPTQVNLFQIIAKKIQEIPGMDGELKKVEDLRVKIMSVLLNIKNIISKNSDSSSLAYEEDLDRIYQRTVEFGARFKRNYAYSIKCQLDELKTMEINPLLIKKKSKVIAVIQKLSSAHQGVLQSLQVIEKQLQTIAVIGLTEEIFFVFYNYIYELTFMLKPFYGLTKTVALDDVEKLVLETMRQLKDLKEEQTKVKCTKPKEKKGKMKNKQTKNGKILKKDKLLPKSPYANKLVKKPSKQSVQKHDEKPIEKVEKDDKDKDEKFLNFMMNIKQRPGREVRRNRGRNYQCEPKTMVEILAENERDSGGADLNGKDSNSQEKIPMMSPLPAEIFIEPKQPEPAHLEQESEPKNVKLITIKRIDSSEDEIQPRKLLIQQKETEIHLDNLIKYRDEFREYKKSNPLYNKKSLLTVKNMTEKLMDEALSNSLDKVMNTINLNDISVLKTIMEEEIK